MKEAAIIGALVFVGNIATWLFGAYMLGKGLSNPELGWAIASLVWFHKSS